jgi:hypothetical protein
MSATAACRTRPACRATSSVSRLSAVCASGDPLHQANSVIRTRSFWPYHQKWREADETQSAAHESSAQLAERLTASATACVEARPGLAAAGTPTSDKVDFNLDIGTCCFRGGARRMCFIHKRLGDFPVAPLRLAAAPSRHACARYAHVRASASRRHWMRPARYRRGYTRRSGSA